MTSFIRRLAIVFGAPVTAHPCGKVYVRINDHWLPL
jgi:hypothetical protein